MDRVGNLAEHQPQLGGNWMLFRPLLYRLFVCCAGKIRTAKDAIAWLVLIKVCLVCLICCLFVCLLCWKDKDYQGCHCMAGPYQGLSGLCDSLSLCLFVVLER